MKISKCDYEPCGKQVEAERAYGNPPGGWINLSVNYDSKTPGAKYEIPKDFCSEGCAIAYLQERKRDQDMLKDATTAPLQPSTV